MRQIRIFDTTLRDGEQSPGASMNIEEKVEVARHLAKLNVDVIEAGFAISSAGDFESIKKIAQEVKGPYICSLARAKKEDIDRAWEAVKYSDKPYIHVFLATSPIHMQDKLKKTEAEVLEMAVKAIQYAKTLCPNVQFSAEDAGRSDIAFLAKIFEAVIQAGVIAINVPDTVGYTTPYEFGELIKQIIAKTKDIDKVVVAAHCHNDLGMATANSLAAVYNGASQVECTINGIGERAGNTALEEIVMALKIRQDFFQAETQILTENIYKTSRLVSAITGIPVQPNKAIVGANAFAHESGIHQDGVLKNKRTYEIMDAESIGLANNSLVLGKHSGRHAFKQKLESLGFELSDADLKDAFEKFKDLADKKKEVLDDDIESLLTNTALSVKETFSLKEVRAVAGNTQKPSAEVILIKDHKEIKETADGDGPVDAVYRAIDKIIDKKINLKDYLIQAVTGGTDALGKVTVRIEEQGKIFTGHGADTDIVVSSVQAYLNAINKMLEKTAN